MRSVDDPWSELRGIRAPGTGVPNVIAVGTRRGKFGKDFAAVHGKGPAVVVELEGADYGRLVVTLDDAAARARAIAEAVAARLRLQGRGLSARVDPPVGAGGSAVVPGHLEADGTGDVALGDEADDTRVVKDKEAGALVAAHERDGVF